MPAAIATSGLTKRFGATVALDDMTLTVEPGEVFGFLGPNGAGKTTTLRLLIGALHPTSGSATVLGLDPWSDTVPLHRRVAYVPGEAAVWPNLTGRETLELLGNMHGDVDTAYRDGLIERLRFDPSKKGRSYSKGNRQKIALIAALMTRAELLLLDEPTSGLDPLMEVTFREEVVSAAGRGQTVFLSSHMLSEVDALCTRVAILRAGRLVETGSLGDLRHLRATVVDVEFAGAAPELAAVDGVEVVGRDGHRARYRVQGSVDGLLKALSQHPVRTLVSEEPSLEEIFLAYYGHDG